MFYISNKFVRNNELKSLLIFIKYVRRSNLFNLFIILSLFLNNLSKSYLTFKITIKIAENNKRNEENLDEIINF